MKVTELMINDWVSVNGSNYQVKEIKKKGVIKLYMNTEYGELTIDFNTDFIEDSVEPIKLTEDILHKNGFDLLTQKALIAENGDSPIIFLISDDHRITLCNSDRLINSCNAWCVRVDTQDMRTMLTVEITYVHELQHVLSLCKIDKKIVV